MIGFGSSMMGGSSGGLGMGFGILGSLINIIIWVAVFAIAYKLLTGRGTDEYNSRLSNIEKDMESTKKTLNDIMRKLDDI